MSTFQELKRRNVIRVAFAYIVTAWLLLQVADLVLNNVGAPDWVFPTILMVIGLGFVPAVLFSWAYEITPEGIKREKDVDRSQSVTAVTAHKLDRAIIVILLLAVAYFSYDKLSDGPDPDEAAVTEVAPAPVATTAPAVQAAATSDGKSSIAVLPFVNMSSDVEQEYFSDGISEELLNLLAKIREFRVAGRTSSFAFKGQNDDLREIGRSLGVDNILEGSVRKSGDRVRITAQLVKVDDGYHLWSETYDRELHDIFAVQDEIAGAVVKELQVTLLGDRPQHDSSSALMENTDAYNAYLQGLFYYNKRGPDNYDTANGYFETAVALAPDSALAWAALGRSSSDYAGQTSEDPAAAIARAREATAKALELDDTLPEAYMALSSILSSWDWDWQGAEAATRRALELRPGDVRARSQLGGLLSIYGRAEEALEVFEEARQQEPLDKSLQLNIASELFNLARYTEAERVMASLLERDPSGSLNNAYMGFILDEQGRSEEAVRFLKNEPVRFLRYTILAMAYQRLGDHDAAVAEQQALLEDYGDQASYQQAQIHCVWGEIDLCAQWLQRAYEARDPGIVSIKTDNTLKVLRGHPVYEELLRKMNIPD